MSDHLNSQSGSENNNEKLIAGRYKIGKLLGSGTFGNVYYAEDVRFNPPRAVALKVLQKQFISEEATREEIKNEASVLARFSHPNILRVIDFDVSSDFAYIVTELAEGGSLAKKIRPDPTLPPVRMPLEEVAHYLDQISDALDEAHSHGLIHRDIKPLNILLDRKSRPLLADFGLASALSGSASSVMIDTNASGTPLYMAPEQWMGQAGKASDIYALGVVTYHLITGQPPFTGNHAALSFQHMQGQIPLLSAKAPGLIYPLVLDEVIAGVLAKDPHTRTKPASEFSRRFREALIPSAPSSSAYQNTKPYIPILESTQSAVPSINSDSTIISTPSDPIYSSGSVNKLENFDPVFNGLPKNFSGTYSGKTFEPHNNIPPYPPAVPVYPPSKKKNLAIPLVGGALLLILLAGGLFFLLQKPQGSAISSLGTDSGSIPVITPTTAFSPAGISPNIAAAHSPVAFPTNQSIKTSSGNLPNPTTAFLPTATRTAVLPTQTTKPAASVSAKISTPTSLPVVEKELTPLVSATASSTHASEDDPKYGHLDYNPGKAVDNDLSTGWVKGVDGNGIGERLILTFPKTVKLTRFGMDIGYDRDEQIFYKNYRIKSVKLQFSDGSTKVVNFEDQRGIQYTPLDGVSTSSVIIYIQSVYPTGKYEDTAIAEVKLWGYE